MTKRILPFLLVLTMALTGCQSAVGSSSSPQTESVASSAVSVPEEPSSEGTVNIQLSDETVLVDGQAASSDPVNGVYIANDIVFYLAGQDFTYGEGTEADGHEQSEAAAHTVVHISQPGVYSISGKLSQGQVAVDLGDNAKEDPDAVVTLILDGVDITCTVAPGVIFYNVYECGSKDTETASETVDTSAAGANVVIADGSVNTVNGAYVARIYKPDSVVLNEAGTEVEEASKLHKYDAAFYSKRSMNVSGGEAGTGILNINAENEGLDSELHLTINGGNININAGNDGINTNEDGVSVTTINGGNLNIHVNGSTGEGDGIDSNGWLVINGGSVTAAAYDVSADSGIDSDMGIYLNGGFVAATGNMLDRIAGSQQNYTVFRFARQQSGGSTYTMKDADGNTVAEYAPENGFSCLIFSAEGMVPGSYTLWQGDIQLAGSSDGMGGMMGMGGGFGGQQPPEMPEGAQPGQIPEGIEPPEGFDPSQQPGGTQPGQMPEGMEPPEGFDPSQPPEEMAPDQIPDGMPQGGRPGTAAAGETSTEFAIVAGGSSFSGVGPA